MIFPGGRKKTTKLASSEMGGESWTQMGAGYWRKVDTDVDIGTDANTYAIIRALACSRQECRSGKESR